jgi:hypothetical protein
MRYYRLINIGTPSESKFEGKVWPPREKTYPNGDAIPESLPDSYQLHQDCVSCAYYSAKTTICSMYKAPVLSTYWCHTWEGK